LQTVTAILETALAEEDGFGGDPAALARHPLLIAALSGHRGLLALDAALNLPVIGLGASAPTYYPAVGARLRCAMTLPEHAGVANAIGAVVGRVRVRRSGTVTSPSEGRFRAHLQDGPQDFGDADAALAAMEEWLARTASDEARAAGAQEGQVRASRDMRTAAIEAREVFVEALVTVEASGRPRIAAE
jgi:hypothetical protein